METITLQNCFMVLWIVLSATYILSLYTYLLIPIIGFIQDLGGWPNHESYVATSQRQTIVFSAY